MYTGEPPIYLQHELRFIFDKLMTQLQILVVYMEVQGMWLTCQNIAFDYLHEKYILLFVLNVHWAPKGKIQLHWQFMVLFDLYFYNKI